MRNSKRLIDAYKNTDFIFYPNNSLSILKVGKKNLLLDELLGSIGSNEAAFITPWNPRSQFLSFDENKNRMKRLVKYLEKKNLSFIYGIGRSRDGKHFEDSVLILDISKDEAMAIGKRYRQNAIVTYQIKKEAKLEYCFS